MAFESRDSRKNQTPIAQRKLTFSTLVGENSDSIIMSINGEILSYTVVAPALTTDTVCSFTVKNDDDITIYDKTDIPDNATTSVLVSNVPMGGTTKFEVSFTTNQISSWAVYVYYK